MSSSNRFRNALILACALFALDMASSSAMADELAEARAAVEKRFDQLHDLRVEFELEQRFTPSNGDPNRYAAMKAAEGRNLEGGGVRVQLLEGSLRKHCTWRVLGDRVRFESQPDEETKRSPICLDAGRTISIHDDRTEMLAYLPRRSPNQGQGGPSFDTWGQISNIEQYPEALIDVALGLRVHHGDLMLSRPALQALEVVSHDEQSLVVSHLDKNGLHLLRFSREYGWGLQSYRILRRGQPYFHCECDDFAPFDGISLPRRVTMSYRDTFGGGGGEIKREILTVTRVVVAPKDGGETVFPITFPKGVPVSDSRHDLTVEVRDGNNRLIEVRTVPYVDELSSYCQALVAQVKTGWKPTKEEAATISAQMEKLLIR